MEYLRDNQIKIWSSKKDSKGKILDIANVEKVILERENTDSLVLLTQVVTFQQQWQKIYVEYLLRGDVNLLLGVSKLEKDIFFISSTNLPNIRRINGVHPKTFLFTYFPKCDDVKKTMTEEISYDRVSLKQAITKLANCANQRLQATELSKTKSVKDASFDFNRYISLGVTGASGYAFHSMDKFEGTTFTAKSILTGFGLNIQINLTNRLSYSAGFHAGFVQLVAKDMVTSSIWADLNTSFDFSYYSTISYRRTDFIPLELKYRFIKSRQKIEPIASFGVVINTTIAPLCDYGDVIYERIVFDPSKPSISVPPSLPLLTKIKGDRGFGMFVTLGLQRRLNEYCAVSLGAKYTHANDIIFMYDSAVVVKELFNKVQRFDLYAHLLFTIK